MSIEKKYQENLNQEYLMKLSPKEAMNPLEELAIRFADFLLLRIWIFIQI